MAKKAMRDVIVALSAFLAAILITIFILNWEMHARTIANLGVFLVKLIPYVFALVGIAYLPVQKLNKPMQQVSLVLAFAILFCYFVPQSLFLFANYSDDFERFYLVMQMMVPYLILVISFSLRVGGASKKDAFVFGAIGLVFMLSGIEDLFALILTWVDNPSFVMPEVWDWADHITVRVGRPLRTHEAYIFIAAHFLIIGLILFFVYGKRSPMRGLLSKSLSRERRHVSQSE